MKKDFNNFLATLTEEETAALIDRAADILDSNREELSENPKTALGNQVSAISLFISLGLLERYHDWNNS